MLQVEFVEMQVSMSMSGDENGKKKKKKKGVLTQIETPPERLQGGFGVTDLPESIFGDPTVPMIRAGASSFRMDLQPTHLP